MEVRASGGEDFKRLGAKFRAAGKDGAEIRKALTKTVQGHLNTIISEQKAAAVGMKVKGVKGRGTLRRSAFHQSASLRGRKARARKGGYGLRAAVAQGIKGKVSYTGKKLGARITVETSHLPPSQRTLPRHLDNPRGWRHPVWGNREVWVKQVGEPYFSGPIERHLPEVRRDIRAAVDDVMRRLA